MNSWGRIEHITNPIKRMEFFVFKYTREKERKMENNLILIFFDIELYVNAEGKDICYCISYRRNNKIKYRLFIANIMKTLL
jgi:hypothetical protein